MIKLNKLHKTHIICLINSITTSYYTNAIPVELCGFVTI